MFYDIIFINGTDLVAWDGKVRAGVQVYEVEHVDDSLDQPDHVLQPAGFSI